MPPSPPSSSSPSPTSTTATLCALTILGLLQAFALAVFMLGFFLTRQEVPHYSHCEDKALWPVLPPSSPPPSPGTCWSSTPTPRFSKAIIVVIDALRFDFMNPYDDEALAERLHQEGTPDASYHLNKLPIVRELLAADPSRALLYRFEADPPTTTVQRLKGLTTGALPTFLDFRQNFHSPAIVEDNLIYQLKQAGKRLTFMGDDTWELLFPGAFDHSFPFPSFNTRDLDTVDNGVRARKGGREGGRDGDDDTRELLFPGAFDRFFPFPNINARDLDTVDNVVLDHLLPELHRSFPPSSSNTTTTTKEDEEGKEEEWDVLIAHFLGADHVGHTHGPSHPAMANKLSQLDIALRTIVRAVGGKEGGGEGSEGERIEGGGMEGGKGEESRRRGESGGRGLRRGEEAKGGGMEGGREGGETLLIVMGDHGMTDDGNHGGASKEETEAALFLYSPGRKLISKAKEEGVYIWEDEEEGGREGGGGGLKSVQLEGGAVPRRVAQVDLVPTLSLLLGVAVPYSNLGGIVPELFFSQEEEGGREGGWEGLVHAFQANAYQLHRYLVKYGEVASLPSAEMETLEKLYRKAVSAHEEGGREGGREGGLEEVCRGYRFFLREALELGRRVWTQYDVGLMLWGVLVLALSLLLGLVMMKGRGGIPSSFPSSSLNLVGKGKERPKQGEGERAEVGGEKAAPAAHDDGDDSDRQQQQQKQQYRQPPLPSTTLLLHLFLGALAITLVVSFLFPTHFLQQGNDHAATVIPCLLLSLVLAGLILSKMREGGREGWVGVGGREGGSLGSLLLVLLQAWAGVGGREGGSLLLVLLHGVSLFSNSYIEGEEKTYLFLGGSAAALLWVGTITNNSCRSSSKSSSSSNNTSGSSSSDNSKKNSNNTSRSSRSSSTSSSSGIIYPAWLLPALLTRLAFEAKGHGQDVAAHFHLLPTLLPLLFLLLGYHHLSSSSTPSPVPSKRTILLSLSYLLLLLHWLSQIDAQDLPLWATDTLHLGIPRLLYLSSLLGFIFLCSSSSSSSSSSRTTTTTTSSSSSKGSSSSSNTNFCLDVAALSLSPPLLLVLGPLAPWSLLCLSGTLYSLRRFCAPPSLPSSLPYLVAVSFLGRAFFFATGHHSQFNRLQYSAAFVGFDEFSFGIGGMLLFLNTFGTELLVVLMVGHEILSSSASSSLPSSSSSVASSSSLALSSSFPSSLPPSLATLLHLSAFRTLLTTLCVLLHRRHLMVWAVFAPKFIFDVCLHVVMSVAWVGLLWGVWWREGGRKRRRR